MVGGTQVVSPIARRRSLRAIATLAKIVNKRARVRLIHWHAGEATERAARLRGAGYEKVCAVDETWSGLAFAERKR